MGVPTVPLLDRCRNRGPSVGFNGIPAAVKQCGGSVRREAAPLVVAPDVYFLGFPSSRSFASEPLFRDAVLRVAECMARFEATKSSP